MAAPALYWRISLRDQAGTSNARIQLKRLTVHNTSGTNVTGSATVTTNFATGSGTLANLNDGDDATVFEASWGGGGGTFLYFQYQFASAVELSYFTIRSGTTVTANNRVYLYNCDFLLQSSDNGTTWTTQAVLGRPAAADDTVYQFAMTVDSLYYPLPNRTQLGGTGGIYGIVSEDGVALPNRPVILYERDGFEKIGYTTTDVNGGYAFNGLNTARDFMVLSYDPSGPPYKNALVWDRITPINTLGALVPSSRFWARRLRDSACGTFYGATQLLDGATYNYYEPTVGGGYASPNQTVWQDGATIDTVPNGNGLYAFIKSNRTAGSSGVGLFWYSAAGAFGLNTAGNTANYTNLTFEYIFVPPTATESDLCICFVGSRDDNDAGPYANSSRTGRGPTLHVTSSALYVRFPLGAANLSTVRATTSVTQGQIHHVVVTYTQDTSIKLYLNGSLIQTTSIAGAGRIFTYDTSTTADLVASWDSATTVSQAMRRLYYFHLHGAGTPTNTSVYSSSAWGGRFGLAGFFGRTMSDSEVAALYDSFVNPYTHTVLPTQSGYAGEVEADNPVYYDRLNQLSMPANSASWPLLGRKDMYGTYRSGTTFGATGFVSGSTATNFNDAAAGLQLTGYLTSTTFTIECFIRPLSLAANGCIFCNRWYNSNVITYLQLSTAGQLSLWITDQSNTTTTFAFSHTALTVSTDYHIAVTYEPWTAKQVKLYINGALVNTQTAGTLPANLYSTWCAIGINLSGTAPSYSDQFRGVIGEFAFYNYALAAARIQAHYDARNS